MRDAASSGMRGADVEAAAGLGAGVERAAVERDAFAHPEQPVTASRLPREETPSFRTATSRRAGAYRRTTSTRVGRACLSAFVSDSCTIRYAGELDSGRERMRRRPPMRSSTGSPASRIRATRALELVRHPAAARAIGSGSVRTQHAQQAPQLGDATRARSAGSTAAAAAPARHHASSTSSAAPAWTPIRLTLCARMSCSSRAIRSRSCSSTASRSRS